MAQPTINEGSLATAEGSALEALLAVADQLRRETVGDAITYVVNRNINFTNVCFVGCSFCGFGRGPAAARAKLGNAAPRRFAFRAGCRAISTDFSTAICCAPSSMRFPGCTCMRSRQWRWITA